MLNNNKIKEYKKIIDVCNATINCVGRCKLVLDHGGKRHSKVGKNQATIPEIQAVIYISSGLRVGGINRQDYITTVNPDHSIIVTEKPGKGINKGSGQWHASADQLDRYFNSAAAQSSSNNKVINNAIFTNTLTNGTNSSTNGSTNTQGNVINLSNALIQQDNSKLVNSLSELYKAATLIGAVVTTIGAISFGPAKENLKTLGDSLKALNKGIDNIAKKIALALRQRRK